MLNAHTKIKDNSFEKSKHHIPYYTVLYFNPGKEEGGIEMDKAKTASIKIPVRIDSREGETKSNVTSLSIKTITHFNNNVKGI